MDFGKLLNIENVLFSLPPDALLTAISLNEYRTNSENKHLYIGCTGWSMKEWVGEVYPQGTKSQDYLYQYGKQFNTIELNTTHYRTPSVSDIKKWYQQTPPDFRFAPKLLQTISHAKNLGLGTGLTEQFCENIQELKEKLGICFMQLPPHFQYKDLKTLEIFLKKFPNHIPLAIELRHETWFSNPQYFNTVMNLLRQYRVSTVITDVAGRRDVLHQSLTTPIAVIRFVGNDLHPTDYTRIEEWVLRLKYWYEMGLQEAYFFTHEPDNIKAPKLAKFLYDIFSASVENITTRAPKFISNTVQQTSLF